MPLSKKVGRFLLEASPSRLNGILCVVVCLLPAVYCQLLEARHRDQSMLISNLDSACAATHERMRLGAFAMLARVKEDLLCRANGVKASDWRQ
jgi:hypothetical protein